MWPSSKSHENAGRTDIDMDRPVTNPRLVKAIDAYHADPGQRQLDKLLIELQRATFLVATLMDEADVTGRRDSTRIEAGSRIKFLQVAGPNGERTLPLFTDWNAIKLFTSDPVSGLVVSPAEAWELAARQFGAAVVNPAGPFLHINRDQLLRLSRMVAPA